MASNKAIQSFIVSGVLDTFDREIDLSEDGAHEKITKLSKKFRALFQDMHDRVDDLAAASTRPRE